MPDTPEARALALEAILPTSTDRYIALFLGDPIYTGVEITLAGYARVAHQDWTTAALAGESRRSNASDILFPTVTEAGQADHWAIFDSPVGGVLLRAGLVVNGVGAPFPINFTGLGDEARFQTGRLVINACEA